MNLKAIAKYLFVLNLLKDDKIVTYPRLYNTYSEKYACTQVGFRCILVSLEQAKLIEKASKDKYKRTNKKLPKWLS